MNIFEFNELKENDTIICINNIGLESVLTLNKKYKIELNCEFTFFKLVYIINDLNLLNCYRFDFFETENSYRRIKLRKLIK